MPYVFIPHAATGVHVFDAFVTTFAHGVENILPVIADISTPVGRATTPPVAVAVPSANCIETPVGVAVALAMTTAVPSVKLISIPVTGIILSVCVAIAPSVEDTSSPCKIAEAGALAVPSLN
jgi:hypothetical protein